MVGILSYGTYVPKYRIKTEEIAKTWGKIPGEIVGSLGLTEKSVPASDEDAVTIAIESAQRALEAYREGTGSEPGVGALFVGSESHPYAVNPTSTIVGELLGIGHDYLAADMEFACKAGTAGMQAIAGLIEAGHIEAGMAIGADTAQSKPHDALEYTSASAGAAFILGNASSAVATLEGYVSYSSDTPDFWRRDGIRYPSHAGRFTGEPAYFTHVLGAAKLLFDKIGKTPGNISHAVFHMPNGKFPRDAAKRLGFSPEQLAPSLTIDRIGNPYSASAMLGLAAVLDVSEPGDSVFMVSYGSGAGSDGFFWNITDKITAYRKIRQRRGDLVSQQFADTAYVDYVGYLKRTHKI